MASMVGRAKAWLGALPNRAQFGLNDLIKDAQRNPFEGIGKPEALKHSLSDCWSHRIDETNRLVYQVHDEALVIISCRYHY